MYNVSEGGLVGHPLDAPVAGPPPGAVTVPLGLLPLGARHALAHQLHQVPQLQPGVPGVVVQNLGQQQRLLPHRHAPLDELRPRRLQLLVYLLRRVQPDLHAKGDDLAVSFFCLLMLLPSSLSLKNARFKSCLRAGLKMRRSTARSARSAPDGGGRRGAWPSRTFSPA